MSASRILVVDDEAVVRDSLREWFTQDGYHVETAEDGEKALKRLREESWDLLLLDIKMPGMDGLEVQRNVREIDPDLAVVIITAYASVDTAVRALKEGAYDYVTKPFDPDDLAHLVSRALERQKLVRENEQLRTHIEESAASDIPEIIGDSPETHHVKEMIRTVSKTDSTVLLIGESGTGKELVARAVHRNSERRHMPMVTVNCAGLAEGLIESELFGHEKGAFTGAEYRRKGKFELADGGTIFLDEIGDISPKTQIDLLRVLEDKSFTRVGGTRPINTDFRVVAATNQDLSKAVQAGRFRLDLYYRINVFRIELPALRERADDIPMLARHFAEKYAQAMGRASTRISESTMEALQAYGWPGNVRELENAIERAVVVQKGPEIRRGDLPLPSEGETEDPTVFSLSELEKRHIQAVLTKMKGNVSRSARALEIDRVTLYNKIRKYGLTREN